MLYLLLNYITVRPFDLERSLYWKEFINNMRLSVLPFIFPIICFLGVWDGNRINDLVRTFYAGVTVGFPLIFGGEVAAATGVRLASFLAWEEEVFKLTPEIPSIILPWVLREKNYRPKRITLFAADFFTSCVACPIIEEIVKMWIVKLCTSLPSNYSKPTSSKKRTRKTSTSPVTNINPYVTSMLVASCGIKLVDCLRRVLVYGRGGDEVFYAVARGAFPIQELCGCLTALQWARRDVLGVEMGLFGLISPAVFIHGMANFRGMKPIFKWNSSKPWTEMQLSPFSSLSASGEASSGAQTLNKTFSKILWVSILMRVTGYCVKNYYLINRQAIKRITRYAGNEDAFEAELITGKALKSKEKK